MQIAKRNFLPTAPDIVTVVARGREKISCDAQFHFINDAVLAALAENHPVISVDTKKKELAGDFKNAGDLQSSQQPSPQTCMRPPHLGHYTGAT
jgi:hypothetical protein